MSHDIDAILSEWPRRADEVQTRLIRAGDGRQVIQVRIDLGVMQMETTGRPDGERPGGYRTYYDLLQAAAAEHGDGFTLSAEQCAEADREFVQFYHRRVGWLSLRKFDAAVADADHTLAFMDFVRDHAPSAEYAAAREQYRGFVLFHRTQAAAAAAVERDKPEEAIDALRAGMAELRRLQADRADEDDEAAGDAEDDGMVATLKRMEEALRQMHGIEATLQEQLEAAIANEEYEAAARLRDALRRRH